MGQLWLSLGQLLLQLALVWANSHIKIWAHSTDTNSVNVVVNR